MRYQTTKDNTDRLKAIRYAFINMCRNPKMARYHRYGGKGIRVCDRWLESFENFIEDVGERDNTYYLARIDKNGNFEPGNVEWLPYYQESTSRSSSYVVTYQKVSMELTEWSQLLGLQPNALRNYMRRSHVSFEKAVAAFGLTKKLRKQAANLKVRSVAVENTYDVF